MVIENALNKSMLVIPSINGGKLLERMLATLRIPGELVVVIDQGSTDNTEEICRRFSVHLEQLGHPHTYTQACNIGAEIAKKRGCDYLFVANNDITFTTDVMRELLEELIADPDLGIVAPAQMLIDQTASFRKVAYRVFWNLETLSFAHDFTPPCSSTHRIESDFCELTFAGMRMSTIDRIGFLDNDYGFYHEDADFGFRLRDAGFTCAYLPNSQIEHWTSSTVSAKPSKFKQDYLKRNKNLFEKKFLGRYVTHQEHHSKETNSWNVINKNLNPYLRKYGLVRPGAPELTFTHPGTPPFDFLYTVWETSRPPETWLAFAHRYKLVLTTSRWGVDVLKQAGFDRVHYAPLGVESDIFQPWGSSERFFDGKTFLWFSHNQYRKGLDVMLKAWHPFHQAHPNCKLILMGVGIEVAMPVPDNSRTWKHSRISEYISQGISVYETLFGRDEETLAMIYRSVDFTISSSRAEGFGFSVAESMACGIPSIFGNYSSTTDFAIPGALMLHGNLVNANYSDKGFGDVGTWWEPSVDHLTKLLFEANDMDCGRYRSLSERGVREIRTRFSWRESSLAIRRALIAEDLGGSKFAKETFARNNSSNRLESADFSTTRSGFTGGNAAIRWNGIASRMIRRFGLLFTFFADELDNQGLTHAISSTSKQLIGPYFKSRTQLLKRTLSQLQWYVSGEDKLRHGVLFIGYAEGGLGLGQAFRANLKAAETAGISFSVYPFNVGIETRLIGPYMDHLYDTKHAYQINVIEVAADQIPVVFQTLEPKVFKKSYNILRTYWELARAPEEWRTHLENVDEIWAPNKFIADAFSHIFKGPIIIVRPAMEELSTPLLTRSNFGMEENRFYFIFSFDYYSSPFRKNPMGVLDAFQRAFPKGDEKVGLIIKSIGAADHYPDIKGVIDAAALDDPRILIFDKNMARDEMLGLICMSDAYVSLHRAEGFGLGMAEAMAFGRIVIGTNYSGCTDFLTEKTGYPVPFELRTLKSHEYPWSEGQSWAEPDQKAAIDIMRHTAGNFSDSNTRRLAGQANIIKTHSPSAIGEAMRERLDVLFAMRQS